MKDLEKRRDWIAVVIVLGVMFIASSFSGDLTGQTLRVDGGSQGANARYPLSFPQPNVFIDHPLPREPIYPEPPEPPTLTSPCQCNLEKVLIPCPNVEICSSVTCFGLESGIFTEGSCSSDDPEVYTCGVCEVIDLGGPPGGVEWDSTSIIDECSSQSAETCDMRTCEQIWKLDGVWVASYSGDCTIPF